jgi:prepilin-type processing-associated H-X9-DG protein
MDNKFNIGFVDAHAKCNRCNNNLYFVFHPHTLYHSFLILTNVCMVKRNFESFALQLLTNLFTILPRYAIDNPRFIFIFVNNFDDIFYDIPIFLSDFVIQIRPIKGRLEIIAVSQSQPINDILFDDLRHSCSQTENRNLWEILFQ